MCERRGLAREALGLRARDSLCVLVRAEPDQNEAVGAVLAGESAPGERLARPEEDVDPVVGRLQLIVLRKEPDLRAQRNATVLAGAGREREPEAEGLRRAVGIANGVGKLDDGLLFVFDTADVRFLISATEVKRPSFRAATMDFAATAPKPFSDVNGGSSEFSRMMNFSASER